MIVTLSGRIRADSDTVRFDFESGDLQGWRVVRGEFAKLVSDRATYHTAPTTPYNKQGTYYLSTVEQDEGPSNDTMMGAVESPVFTLGAPKMTFLIGGGNSPETYIALCTLNGREVRRAHGVNSEAMRRIEWEAPELVGKPVFLRAMDGTPEGWGHITFDDFQAAGTIDPEASEKRFAEAQKAFERLDLFRRVEKAFERVNLETLRPAVEDLTRTYPERYAQGPEFLRRIGEYSKRLEAAKATFDSPDATDTKWESDLEATERLIGEIETFQREALIANPLVSGQPILYVNRAQYKMGGHHAIDTLFHTGEINTNVFAGGGAIKTIDFAKGGEVKTLFESREGLPRDPEVHFSGERIVFAFRKGLDDDYHIYEMQADGSNLRQLTGAPGVCDFDPLYLPDNHIAFSSTREPKYNQCSRDIAANLFRMEPDGANIHQIGKNNLFDNHGTLLPDGRILYARWEYVDRNFGDAHGIWTVNPDGTNQSIYWGNNTAVPGAVYNPRPIPGSQQMLCIFGMHHYRLWGALAIVDRRLGLDGREPVVRTWPPDVIEQVRAGGPFDCDSMVNVYPKYSDPWPLSDKYFLCSRMTFGGDRKWIEGDARYGHEMGIYLVDVFGNEILLHVEEPACFDPMPLAPSPRPDVIPSRCDLGEKEGFFYVADVYEGTHMQGVERGTVKSLRIVEAPEKRVWSMGAWFGQGYTAPAMNWHSLENKRIIGTVPVEEDGSAYFVVPSETFVFFQLLDADGMMVQSMRSGASVQPGERMGCIGCHDARLTAPPPVKDAMPLALSKPPARPRDWYGPARPFGFTAEVQPVFDKHCVGCHDYGKKAGERLNLAPDRTFAFNTAYTELWRKGYVTCVGAGPAEVQPAYSWGSHASKLVAVLRKGHKDVRLSAEELDRIVTWTDLNGVYYAHYDTAYPDSLTGRCPLDTEQLGRLGSLTGVSFDSIRSYASNPGPMISFDRPELSPCLAQFSDKNDPAYKEALALIEAGKRQLAERPRADMPGFQPCPVDSGRNAKYMARRSEEERMREAMRQGRKAYDPGLDREIAKNVK